MLLNSVFISWVDRSTILNRFVDKSISIFVPDYILLLLTSLLPLYQFLRREERRRYGRLHFDFEGFPHRESGTSKREQTTDWVSESKGRRILGVGRETGLSGGRLREGCESRRDLQEGMWSCNSAVVKDVLITRKLHFERRFCLVWFGFFFLDDWKLVRVDCWTV